MGKTSKALAKKFGQLKIFVGKIALIAFQVSLFFIILYRVVPVPITPLPLVRLFEQAFGDDPVRLKKDWESIESLGRNICLASVTSEDPKFFQHYGFDFEQIIESLKKSFDKGKRPRGASTITQQTAKNLFFTPRRSWLRKGLEVYVTVCLELFWTKKRILEVYLNIIEMGNGVYGAEAASLYYFNKSSGKLTANEAAAIAACYPNPRRWKANKPSRYIKKKQNLIARYMYRIGSLPWENKKKPK
ncbi:MAG: monofunctional biosynthetic peptidoglycan transglycosylase [Bacteroidia bacterium]|nr:monofunctional biosynthetic peptidoglycan transglycosylase [Bacteroidia bacterium]MCF8428130.1 monofunctional biosynthetic peptidoglycan transglycosylase [Bacteroidia bacterium]